MGFEVFSKKTAARTKAPTITLQQKGIISLSPSAVAMLAGSEESDQHSVELLYDRERKVIGLRLASEDNPNPHLLRRQGRSGVYLVSGKMFTDHYQIDTSRARRYRARQYGEGIVGFGLDDDFAEVGRSKRRDKRDGSRFDSLVNDAIESGEDDR